MIKGIIKWQYEEAEPWLIPILSQFWGSTSLSFGIVKPIAGRSCRLLIQTDSNGISHTPSTAHVLTADMFGRPGVKFLDINWLLSSNAISGFNQTLPSMEGQLRDQSEYPLSTCRKSLVYNLGEKEKHSLLDIFHLFTHSANHGRTSSL